MNKHFYELLHLSRSKVQQYEREAAQYNQIPKGRLRHRLAFSLRTLAERLEPETAPSFALERSL
ncbi:hypothetical protein BH24DEI2_BH24DEI2_00570 [soil metagenome]